MVSRLREAHDISQPDYRQNLASQVDQAEESMMRAGDSRAGTKRKKVSGSRHLDGEAPVADVEKQNFQIFSKLLRHDTGNIGR